jgi:hypothetical protein
MNLYLRISKLVLLLISFMIVFISIFLTKYDTWVIDLFYALTVFSLIIVIDFMFYELFSPNFIGKNHLVFCIFPLSRLNILFFEIKFYLKRWEVLIFLLTTLFYISYFYFNNNSKFLPLFLLLFLSAVQLIYFICCIFIIKNLMNIKYFRINIKNMTSIFISASIMLVIMSEKSDIVKQILYINPFSCGFLSYLISEKIGIVALITILTLSVFLGLMMKIKFREWPL